MKTVTLSRRAIFAGAAFLFHAGAASAGQSSAGKPAAPEAAASKPVRYSATAANMAVGGGVALRIAVFRWSSDEDRSKLLSAMKEKGADQIGNELQALPESGYVWTDESLGYSIHYAYRQALPNGGERIIVATDRPLGSWSGHPWAVKSEAAGSYPFTVIELLLTSGGKGEGKMSLTSKVAADEANKTIALEHAEAAPALLKNVQRTN